MGKLNRSTKFPLSYFSSYRKCVLHFLLAARKCIKSLICMTNASIELCHMSLWVTLGAAAVEKEIMAEVTLEHTKKRSGIEMAATRISWPTLADNRPTCGFIRPRKVLYIALVGPTCRPTSQKKFTYDS